MKTLRLHTLALGAVISLAGTVAAQESAAPPVEFPGLDHFAPLWERSIFTTKDLPAPEADAGPNFADNFGLSGLYEIDGAVVALIVDKTTSLVHTTKIGSENELGIQIRKIAGTAKCASSSKKAVRSAGWVPATAARQLHRRNRSQQGACREHCPHARSLTRPAYCCRCPVVPRPAQ